MNEKKLAIKEFNKNSEKTKEQIVSDFLFNETLEDQKEWLDYLDNIINESFEGV